VLVCTPLAPLGSLAPALWLIVARAGGLLALAACALLAAELAPRRLRAVAGAVAAGALLVAGLNFHLWGTSFAGSVWQGNSEGLLTACVVGALLCHRARRLAWALALGVAAALLRPEAWPFLGAYAIWLWRERSSLRPWIAGGLALVPVLWFGAELWGSGQLFRGAERAQAITPDNPATTQGAAHAVLSRSRPYVLITVQVAVVVAVASAAAGLIARRWRWPERGRGDSAADAAVVALGLFGAAWLGLVALMAQLRIASGNPRYVLLAVAVAAVLGGVGVARIAAWAGGLVRAREQLARAIAAAALCAGLVVSALPQLRGIDRDVKHLRYEASLDGALASATRRAGGRAAVLACGTPVTGPLSVTALAWRLDVPIRRIALAPGRGTVVFRAAPTLDDTPAPATDAPGPRIATSGGWTVSGACAG